MEQASFGCFCCCSYSVSVCVLCFQLHETFPRAPQMQHSFSSWLLSLGVLISLPLLIPGAAVQPDQPYHVIIPMGSHVFHSSITLWPHLPSVAPLSTALLHFYLVGNIFTLSILQNVTWAQCLGDGRKHSFLICCPVVMGKLIQCPFKTNLENMDVWVTDQEARAI